MIDINAILDKIDGSKTARINTFTALETLSQNIDENALTDFLLKFTDDERILKAAESVAKNVVLSLTEVKYDAIEEGIAATLKAGVLHESFASNMKAVPVETQAEVHEFFRDKVDTDQLFTFIANKMSTRSTKVLGALNLIKNQVGSMKHQFFKRK